MLTERHYSAGKRSKNLYYTGSVGGGNLKAGMPQTTDMTITESYRVLYRIKKRRSRKHYNFVPYPYPRRRNAAAVGLDIRLLRKFRARNNGVTPVTRRPKWNERTVTDGETVMTFGVTTYRIIPSQ